MRTHTGGELQAPIASQKAMVTAAELATHHPDVYARRHNASRGAAGGPGTSPTHIRGGSDTAGGTPEREFDSRDPHRFTPRGTAARNPPTAPSNPSAVAGTSLEGRRGTSSAAAPDGTPSTSATPAGQG